MNPTECINIILRMTPEQRTFVKQSLPKLIEGQPLSVALALFGMAEQVCKAQAL